jgi:hypothetical protein
MPPRPRPLLPSVVVILTLQPAQLLMQSRDSTRVSDMANLNTAISLYSEDVGGSVGSANTVYVSIPDPTATSSLGDQCQGLSLISLPATYTYHCAATSTFKSVNGNGWIPLNFSSISAGTPLGILPVDPTNTSSHESITRIRQTAARLVAVVLFLGSLGRCTLKRSIEIVRKRLNRERDERESTGIRSRGIPGQSSYGEIRDPVPKQTDHLCARRSRQRRVLCPERTGETHRRFKRRTRGCDRDYWSWGVFWRGMPSRSTRADGTRQHDDGLFACSSAKESNKPFASRAARILGAIPGVCALSQHSH